MSLEEELRARLRTLADRSGRPSADGPGLAHVVAQETADRRRTRRGLLVAVGCVVALGITLPRVGGPEEADPASGPAVAIGGGATVAAPDADIVTGPTRGSLAGDRHFLDGLRALPWPEEPPVEARDVVFAGDVPGGRWALIVGQATSVPPDAAGMPPDVAPRHGLTAAWFTGPPDATAAQMTLASGPHSIAPDWPVALTDPRNGVLVVVAAPGDVVEVSRQPRIAADGSTSREWREVAAEDGVAITRVSPSPRPYDGSTSYRVLRDGRTEARDTPWSIHLEDPAEQPPIDYLRGPPTDLGEQAARYAAGYVLTELGLSAPQVRITAQWTGSVPAGGAGEAALVTVTLPSGAVVVHALWLTPEQPDGSIMGAPCGQAIQPAGPPAERRVQAVVCEVVDTTTGAPMSTNLVVVGPPEVALVRTYDDDRNFLTEHTVIDGVLVIPLPLGTDTVEAVTDGGVTLGRVDLLGHAVDFGD